VKLTRTLIGFALILLIAVSFATLVFRQNAAFAAITPGSTFLTAFNLETNVAERPTTIFNNSTRAEIYNFIKANPGVQFRGICNALGISIGVAEFHLGVLKKAGLISFFRDGKYKRFFQSKKFSQQKMELISLLRHDTAKSIIKTMLDERQVSHGELAYQLSITSQGVTWQMDQLKKEGLIQESKEGIKAIYTIEERYAPLLTELVNLIEQPST
jgi:predicted transcriptional regulator